jgi:hypothetical protein
MKEERDREREGERGLPVPMDPNEAMIAIKM